MSLPLVPAWVISVLAIICGLLCLLAAFRYPDMKQATRAGLMLISPAFIGFGVIYYYNLSAVFDQEARQKSVRLAMLYLFSALVIWQVILHIQDGSKK